MNTKLTSWLLGTSLLIAFNFVNISTSNVAKNYIESVDLDNKFFDMCECMKTVKTGVIITDTQANKICWQAVEEWLMKKSEASGEVETAMIVSCEQGE